MTQIYIVSTLMDGMVGFKRPLDAESFLAQLPSKHRGLAELIEVPIFDGPIAAQEYTVKRRTLWVAPTATIPS